MLGRILSLVAALLLASASASAHVPERSLLHRGELASPAKTASRGFPSAAEQAAKEKSAASDCRIWENWHPPLKCASSIGYTGHYLDQESGDYYAQQRYYTPRLGRFNRIDPWEGDALTPITLNKYLYGNGNPLVYVDPDGRIALLEDWRAAVNRFGESSLAFAQSAGQQSRSGHFGRRISSAAGWVVGGAGYIGSMIGEAAVAGANLGANAVSIAGAEAGAALGSENVFTPLAIEARGEIDQLVADVAPGIEAVQTDATGAATTAAIALATGIRDQAYAAAAGEDRALFDLIANLNPRQLLQTAKRSVVRMTEPPKVGAATSLTSVEGDSGNVLLGRETTELPTLSMQRSLAELTNETRDSFLNDPHLLARYLRQGEIEAIQSEPWTMRLFFGTAVERRVAEVARERDDLKSLVHTRGNAPQDFIGPECYGYDITGSSEGAIRKHYARSEVDSVISYESIPNNFGYEWLDLLDEH